jgi:CheY-like chemotaxis protein
MGARARRFANETFTMERYGGEFLGLLREVLETRARRERRRWTALGALARALRTSLHGFAATPRSAQVLVVDDDPLVVQWLADSLSAEGHDVDVAGDARAALSRLEETSYDLIVSDLRMPEMDGVAFYRLLERERPQAARRMLFLTGNTEAAEYRAFVAEKRDRTVTKPVDLTELNRAARRILAIHGD